MNIFSCRCRICGKEKEQLEECYLTRPVFKPCECELKQQEQAEKLKQESIEKGRQAYSQAKKRASGLIGRNYEQTFEKFIADEGQASALKACKEYAENPKGNLILSGGVGSGKTHLAAAIVDYLCRKPINPDTALRYADSVENMTVSNYLFIRAFDITEKARQAFDDSNLTVKRCKQAKLLVIDDIGTRGSTYTDFQNATLFDIFDIRYNMQLPTVITTNLVPDELQKCLDTRAYDRIRADSKLVIIKSKSHR